MPDTVFSLSDQYTPEFCALECCVKAAAGPAVVITYMFQHFKNIKIFGYKALSKKGLLFHTSFTNYLKTRCMVSILNKKGSILMSKFKNFPGVLQIKNNVWRNAANIYQVIPPSKNQFQTFLWCLTCTGTCINLSSSPCLVLMSFVDIKENWLFWLKKSMLVTFNAFTFVHVCSYR